jgi:uncharacterized protein
MTLLEPCLYVGTVTHRRLRPVQHQLAYKVACLFMDVDRLEDTAKPLRFLSYNRWNLFSISDRRASEEKSLATSLWDVVKATPEASALITKIYVLCYPAVLGYVFNPLTTFYCFDAAGNIRLMIYEVRNTFGEQHRYVTKVFAAGEPCHTRADKALLVSPFNRIEGYYGLTTSVPGKRIGLGVNLTTDEGPIMKAYFSADKRPLNDWQLIKIFIALPLMTFKVIAGIHWQALKLYAKGLPLSGLGKASAKHKI